MHQRPISSGQSSLRPYLVVSIIIHLLLCSLITVGILSERHKVEKQEALFIADVLGEQQRLEEQEKQARREATKDLLSDQAMSEMEQLVSDQLEPKDETQLLELTQEDIQERVDEWDAAMELEALLNEQFHDLSDELREGAFEDVRGNLKQMKQDLLLTQVRSFIRDRVAPEIKQRIDEKLKHELGERIKTEAAKQANTEKSQRLAEADADLKSAVSALAAVKASQDRVTTELGRSRLGNASRAQETVETSEQAASAKVAAALARVEQTAPTLKEQAVALRDSAAAQRLRPAVDEAGKKAGAATLAEKAVLTNDPKAAPEAHKAAREKADQDRAVATEKSRETSAILASRIAELQALAKEVAAARANRQPDDIERRVVEVAAQEVEAAVREKVESEVTETAVPAAADRIVKALDPDLKKRRLDDEKFREFLEKDIRQALEEEMNRQKPDPELALLKTEQHFDLQDRASIEEAREEIAEVARKLSKLADRQEVFRDEVPVETPSRDAMKQHLLADEIRTVRQQAGRALEAARKATLLHDSKVAEAERQIRNPAVEKTAVEAARAMEREVVSDAKQMMAEVAQDLRASADSMLQLEQALTAEAGAVRERAAQHVDLKEALGPEKAEASVTKVKEAADRAVEQYVRNEVNWAVRSVNLTGILGDEDQVEALAKMAELEGQLDQIAENVEEGRSLADALSLGILGPGQGVGPGGLPSVEDLPWTLPYGRNMSRINLRAYEAFIKDMRDRLNPDNYYSEEETNDDVATRAETTVDALPAVIFLDELPATLDPKVDEAREVPRPDFETLEFGAAAMMENCPSIDGDLSDWGELRHGLKLLYTGSSLTKVKDGPTVYVRWSPDGLYFGYTVQDPNGIQPCPEFSWKGDCLEIMVDMANSRRPEAYLNVDSQKFQLTPFGCQGKKYLTVWEMGRGLRGLQMARGYPDPEGIKGKSAARQHDGGYTVEGFISRRGLAKPLLIPGKYVGLNFSLNQGEGLSGYQWSASQQLQTWRRPDTWGDLLLLGSDAKPTFTTGADSDDKCSGIVPDEVVYIRVDDADMNINTRKIDRVPAELVVKDGGASLFVVLAETGANTGVFRASVSTQAYFMEPREETINVRSGRSLQLVYTDARTEYGEKNRKVTAELAVGWPVMQLGSK